MTYAGLIALVMAAFAAFMGWKFPVDPEALPFIGHESVSAARRRLYGLAVILLVVGLIEIFLL